MSTTTLPHSEAGGSDIKGMRWAAFLRWFAKEWQPGQHMALVGPTGQGKSTFAVGTLANRRYVLACDPKGGDDTLAASGYRRITAWPPPSRVYDDISEGKPARLILGARGARPGELAAVFSDALHDVAKQGGWTCYIDETQIAADRRMMGLGPIVEELLVSARYRKVSMVTAFQAPSWVPTACTRQSTWTVVWPTKDLDSIKAVAGKSGRDWREFLTIVRSLPAYHCAVVGSKPSDPIVITSAPAIS